MGIYTRDYYRHGSFGDSIPPVCKNLIIANVIVFLLQIFITRPATMDDMQATIDRFKQMVQRQTPHLEKRSQKNKDSSAAAKPKASSTSSSTSSESGDKTTHEAENNEPEEDLRSDENLAMANFLPRISIVEEWFQLEASKVVRYGQIWRLITCAFCHDRTSPWHIIFNMLALYWFGGRLEQFYGSKEFLLFYLTAAVVSSLC
jgi:membrane associated rhomboid family serine protease